MPCADCSALPGSACGSIAVHLSDEIDHTALLNEGEGDPQGDAPLGVRKLQHLLSELDITWDVTSCSMSCATAASW